MPHYGGGPRRGMSNSPKLPAGSRKNIMVRVPQDLFDAVEAFTRAHGVSMGGWAEALMRSALAGVEAPVPGPPPRPPVERLTCGDLTVVLDHRTGKVTVSSS